MRTIGLAEAALEKMARRLLSREAFGRRLADQSVWEQRVAEARIDIEMCRLLTLNAADRMDKVGNKVARAEIAMIKVAAPRLALKLIDDAIQAHGAGGLTTDFGLAAMYSRVRGLRIADGPTRFTTEPSLGWNMPSIANGCRPLSASYGSHRRRAIERFPCRAWRRSENMPTIHFPAWQDRIIEDAAAPRSPRKWSAAMPPVRTC